MDGKKYWPALRPFTFKPIEKQSLWKALDHTGMPIPLLRVI